MFIVSKRTFKLRFKDGSVYTIPRDYIGEIPDAAAQHPLVLLAMKDGSIATPAGRKDAQVEEAAKIAAEIEAAHDIRPDAPAKKRSRKKAE